MNKRANDKVQVQLNECSDTGGLLLSRINGKSVQTLRLRNAEEVKAMWELFAHYADQYCLNAEERKAWIDHGRDEGYDDGYTAGHCDGYEEGLAEAGGASE